jgi:hypothetical protein
MNNLKLDAFLQPTGTAEWKGKQYPILPVSLRTRMKILAADDNEEDVVKEVILSHVPGFPPEEIYELPPLALTALFRRVLQVDEADLEAAEKN